jgi:BMFP domain-containing protein YqiC
VGVCRELELFSATLVAIDGSKFKAVNSRDKNFTRKSVKLRLKKTQANIDRYLAKLDQADQEEPEIREVTAAELNQKIASMEAKMEELQGYEAEVEAHPDKQVESVRNFVFVSHTMHERRSRDGEQRTEDRSQVIG